ncbi:MAG: hypothetical protein HY236_02130 [Acidobacteria bacterium]|nr:hypothetical protein [Acidobacteriota bacterium]
MLTGKDTIPESWKLENGGHYGLGPDGKWWFISPFNPTPWLTAGPPPPPPAGFDLIYGVLPSLDEFYKRGMTYGQYQAARDRCEKLKQEFISIVDLPPGADPLDAAKEFDLLAQFDVPKPIFFQTKYGYFGLVPGSPLTDPPRLRWAISSADTILKATNGFIADYQDDLLQHGFPVDKPHPFVPPWLYSPAQVPLGAHTPTQARKPE